MASQIPQLRQQFDVYSTAQKKEFIDKLKVKLQGSNNPEYSKFLNECVQKYNANISRDSRFDDLLDTSGTAKGQTVLLVSGILLIAASSIGLIADLVGLAALDFVLGGTGAIGGAFVLLSFALAGLNLWLGILAITRRTKTNYDSIRPVGAFCGNMLIFYFIYGFLIFQYVGFPTMPIILLIITVILGAGVGMNNKDAALSKKQIAKRDKAKK